MSSTLIPTVPFEQFKKMKAADLKEMKSFEVTANGEHLLTVIIPPEKGGMTITDNIKTQAEYLAHRANSVGGRDPQEEAEKKAQEEAEHATLPV